MPAAEAVVQTRDASRYLIRLCQHARKMRARLGHQPGRHTGAGAAPEVSEAEWSETAGVLVLSLGRCILRVADGTLMLRAEASSPEDLTQIQDLIRKRLEGFGRRERLRVTWQPATDLTAGPGAARISGAIADDNRPAPG